LAPPVPGRGAGVGRSGWQARQDPGSTANRFFQEQRSPEDWASSYYRLAVEAVGTAIHEAEVALGVKPDVEAPTAVTLDELRAARTAPECFVEDLLFADVRLVAAAGGTGKTALMLLELAALAGGAETLYGHRVLRHGPVVYFSGEDSREVIVARLREVIGANGMLGRMATVLRRFFVADVSGTGFRLSAIINDVVVASEEVDRLIGWLQSIEPVAIVIDPLASFSVGEVRINDAEQAMIGVARRIRNAVGCCVSVVHHVGKQNARDGAVDPGRVHQHHHGSGPLTSAQAAGEERGTWPGELLRPRRLQIVARRNYRTGLRPRARLERYLDTAAALTVQDYLVILDKKTGRCQVGQRARAAVDFESALAVPTLEMMMVLSPG